MINRYAAALLSIAIVILTAFVALPEDQVTPAAIVQLALLGLGSIVTYLVPLVDGRWAGLLKTGAAVIAAVLTAVLPFVIIGTITYMQIVVVVLAALNALAVEVGVQMRRSDLRVATHM